MNNERWELHNIDCAKIDVEPKMLEEESAMLILTDPPFGTGKIQSLGKNSYKDDESHLNVLSGIRNVTERYLHNNGTLAVICDYRLAYDLVPFVIDELGMYLRGEIIWEFGLGKPRTSWWPNKHNHVLTFTWGESSGMFDYSAMPRQRRLAPKPGYPETKPAGSVWEYTMSNTDPERVEYPNQKPLHLLTPFIMAHTSENDIVIDPFCGSSSTGVAALSCSRRYVGIDKNHEAIRESSKRLA